MAGEVTTTGLPGVASDPLVGQVAGQESSLSSWAGPYVTDMLGKAKGLSEMPYQAYMGPLTAGASELQDKAFSGLAGLTIPTDAMGAYTPQSFTDPGMHQKFMSPYIEGALNPTMEEARRQNEISRLDTASRLTKAGAYGGSRQAIMESEGLRNLEQNLANIYGTGMQLAFESGQGQFNTEEDRRRAAQQFINDFGLGAIKTIADMGGVQRGIESEGISADMKQFEQERDYPFKMVQFLQSMMQGMPVGTQNTTYNQPSTLSNVMGGAGGILELYNILFGGQ